MDSAPDHPSPGVPTTLAPGPSAPLAPRVSRAIEFAFDGEYARSNLLIASLWLLIPIAGWFAVWGWSCEALHRLEQRSPAPVPRLRLRDFAHYVRRGGPAWLTEQIGMGFLTTLGGLLLAIANATAVTAWIAASSPVVLAIVLALSLVIPLAAIGWATVLWNGMQTRAELTESFGDALAVGDAWRQSKPAWRRILSAYLVFVPASFVLLIAGSALLCVGVLPAYVAVRLAAVHLRWQIYELGSHRGAPRLTGAKPPALLPSERHLLPALPKKGAMR